jgi:hypothetical protein
MQTKQDPTIVKTLKNECDVSFVDPSVECYYNSVFTQAMPIYLRSSYRPNARHDQHLKNRYRTREARVIPSNHGQNPYTGRRFCPELHQSKSKQKQTINHDLTTIVWIRSNSFNIYCPFLRFTSSTGTAAGSVLHSALRRRHNLLQPSERASTFAAAAAAALGNLT